MASSKKTKSVKKKSPAKKAKLSAFKMPESADIAYVGDFLQDIKKLVKGRQKKVVIDCSKIERITTPCIQVFLSAAETLGRSKRALVVKSASSAMEEAFSDLGFGAELKKWST